MSKDKTKGNIHHKHSSVHTNHKHVTEETNSRSQLFHRSNTQIAYLTTECNDGYGNMLQIRVGNVSVLALADSGAMISVISHTFLKNVNRRVTLLPPLFEAVVGVGGTKHEVLYRVVLPIDINGNKVSQEFHVLEGHHSLILGLDFFNTHGVKLNFQAGTCCLGNGACVPLRKPPRKSVLVKTADVIHLPAGKELFCPVIFSYAPKSLVCMKPLVSLDQNYPDLVLVPGIDDPSGKVSVCKLVNRSDCDYHIPRNTGIALAKPLTIPDVMFNCDDAFNGDLAGLDFRGMTDTLTDSTSNQKERFKFNIDNVNLPEDDHNKLLAFLETNRDIFATDVSELGTASATPHIIDTGDAKPVTRRFYRANPIVREEIDKQIEILLRYNIIEPSTSRWTAPVVLVRKKDNSYRFVIDYRSLNKVTTKISYPLVRVEDVWDAIGRKSSGLFSIVDLCSGFWQIDLEESSREKTGFVTQNRQFQFCKLPMGLSNSPATFQKAMTDTLGNLLYDCAFSYIDDVIIFSKSDVNAHITDLAKVFQRLRKAGFKLKPSKCTFGASSVKYLGHILSKDGIFPNPTKTKVVEEFPTPKTTKHVRRFLGICNYYRRFIKDFGSIRTPLNDLLIKDNQFIWSEECEQAFQQLKSALTSAVMLKYAHPSKPYNLTCDASGSGIGYILSQNDDKGTDKVIAYGGRSLRTNEKAYSITEREGLAVVEGIREFQTYLTGSVFTVITDHKALKFIKDNEGGSGRLARWALELAGYDYEVKYKQGAANINADVLSRQYDDVTHEEVEKTSSVACQTEAEVMITPQIMSAAPTQSSDTVPQTDAQLDTLQQLPDVCFEPESHNEHLPSLTAIDIVTTDNPVGEDQLEIATDYNIESLQQNAPITKGIYNYLATGTKKPAGYTDKSLNRYILRDGILYHKLFLGTDTQGEEVEHFRLVIPEFGSIKTTDLRHTILTHYHNNIMGGSHQGFDRTHESIRRKYFWPGMYVAIKCYIRNCEDCQRSKIGGPCKPPPLKPLPIVGRFERWHMDFLGPLHMSSQNNKYILLVTDSFSRWPEAFAVPKDNAETVAKILYEEIFTKYGAPKTLVSDRGKHFMASLVASLCELFQVNRIHTSPYHPQSNSVCERFNAVIGQSLRTYVDENQLDWDVHLPGILMAYRATPAVRSTGMSPYYALFGEDMFLPLDRTLQPKSTLSKSVQEYLANTLGKIRLIHEMAKQNIEKHQGQYKHQHDKKASPPEFKVNQLVLMRRKKVPKGFSSKLCKPWLGPYYIEQVHQNNSYSLRDLTTHKRLQNRQHATRLKRFYGQPTVSDKTGTDGEHGTPPQPISNPAQISEPEEPEPKPPDTDDNDLADQLDSDHPNAAEDMSQGNAKDESDARELPTQEFETSDIDRIKKAAYYRQRKVYYVRFNSGKHNWIDAEHLPQALLTEFHHKYTNTGHVKKRVRAKSYFRPIYLLQFSPASKTT